MAKEKFSVKKFYFRHPIICNLVFMVALGFLLVWGSLIFLDFWTHHGETQTVPDVRNRSFEDARRILSDSGLEIEISDSIYERGMAPGTVIESVPKAGAVVKAGRPVYVTITSFSPKNVTITMPMINAVSERQAKSYLNALGITDITTVYVPGQFSELVLDARADGKVLGVGSRIPVTSRVTLEIGVIASAEEPSDSLYSENGEEMPTVNELNEDGGFFD